MILASLESEHAKYSAARVDEHLKVFLIHVLDHVPARALNSYVGGDRYRGHGAGTVAHDDLVWRDRP